MRRKRRERKEKRNRPIGSIEDKWSNDVARITRVNMEGETALVFTLIGADERVNVGRRVGGGRGGRVGGGGLAIK